MHYSFTLSLNPMASLNLEELMIALQQLKDQGQGQQDQPETRQQPVGHEMASYQGPNQGIQNQQVAVSFFSEEHRLSTKQLGKICYSLCILIIIFVAPCIYIFDFYNNIYIRDIY